MCMFVKDPATDEVWLCAPGGKVALGTDWAGIEADYKAAGQPAPVVHTRATLLARFNEPPVPEGYGLREG